MGLEFFFFFHLLFYFIYTHYWHFFLSIQVKGFPFLAWWLASVSFLHTKFYLLLDITLVNFRPKLYDDTSYTTLIFPASSTLSSTIPPVDHKRNFHHKFMGELTRLRCGAGKGRIPSPQNSGSNCRSKIPPAEEKLQGKSGPAIPGRAIEMYRYYAFLLLTSSNSP